MKEDIARKVYLDGADDAWEYLSGWLDEYYKEGYGWNDFRERIEVMYQQYLANNGMIHDRKDRNSGNQCKHETGIVNISMKSEYTASEELTKKYLEEREKWKEIDQKLIRGFMMLREGFTILEKCQKEYCINIGMFNVLEEYRDKINKWLQVNE